MQHSCLVHVSLPQDTAKAKRVEGLETGLDIFREDWAVGDCQCSVPAGAPAQEALSDHSVLGGQWGHWKGPWELVMFALCFALSICYRPLLEAGYRVGPIPGLTSQSGSYVPLSHQEIQMCCADR